MNKLIKKTIKSVFQALGFELRRSSADGQAAPIELTSAEKKIIDYVVDNQLTMVSYERLWGTLMACKYAVEREIEGDFVECGVGVMRFWQPKCLSCTGLTKKYGFSIPLKG